MSTYSKALELYDQLIATEKSIERKGKTMPYTSLNGHMFSFLSKEGVMGLRLSPTEITTFIARYKGTLMEQHGKVMKAFVEIPQELLEDTDELTQYLQLSISHTKSLKPKPTKK